jgi:hypothetical protein
LRRPLSRNIQTAKSPQGLQIEYVNDTRQTYSDLQEWANADNACIVN